MRRTPRGPWAALCLVLLGSSVVPAVAADVDQLVDGVGEVTAPGCVPGPVAVFGDQAFVVLPGSMSRQRAPLFAAAAYGTGRVFAGGHEGFFSAAALAHEDNARLLLNAVRWLGHGRPDPLRVALCGTADLAAALTGAGCKVTELAPAAVVDGLGAVDVLCTTAHHFSSPAPDAQVEAVAKFVHDGGGLFLNACPWGWQQLNPTRDIRTDMGGNRICARMGLAWADASVSQTGQDGWVAVPDGLELLHAGHALAMLAAQQAGGPAPDKATAAQLGATLSLAMRTVAPDDKILLPAIDRLTAGLGDAAVPGPDQPVTVEMPLARLRLVRDMQALKDLAAQQVTAHPSARLFPGPVPDDAPRVTRTVRVDTAIPAWHSTGLYAAAGEVIEVTVPPAAAGQGLAVRVGCHSDSLWHLDKWQRLPEISLREVLREATTQVASPVGGLLYLDVPNNCKLGDLEVTITHAVEAPLFVLGEATNAEWQATIRQRPAPWAELGTTKVFISVPSQFVRDLADPEALLRFWDRVMDADADLAQRPRQRERPERYVSDVQISAGYMHSGYPIMTFLDAAPRFVDLALLSTKGDWGMFHEMGHNHQSGAWTFGGTGEVTCNLFTLYVLDRVCGIPVVGGRVYQDGLNRKLADYLAKGAPFDEWQRDPFLALRMYVQLERQFGWETYQRVFAAYRDAAKEELPTTDDEKRDQWLVRFSRQVGRNLGPFFQAWGVPTSDAARASLTDLPTWLPDDPATF